MVQQLEEGEGFNADDHCQDLYFFVLLTSRAQEIDEVGREILHRWD